MPRSPINIRQIIIDRMTRLGMTRYRLAQDLKVHMPSMTSIYHFLSGGDLGIENLSRVLDELGLRIKPDRREKITKPDDETKGG